MCNEDKKFHDAIVWGLGTLPGKVEIILGDRVDAQEQLCVDVPNTYNTQLGQTISEVDMVVLCAGVRPITAFVKAELLNERGEIVIDNTMQATQLTTEACPVFAVGDVTQCGWGRAMVADAMAKACTTNLLNFCQGKPLVNVCDVGKKPFLPVLVSLGREQGAANLPFANNFLGRWVKAPTVLAGMIWKNGCKGLCSEQSGQRC